MAINMKKMALMAALLISLFTLVACSSSPKEPAAQPQERVERLLVSRSGIPVDVLPAFTTFTWNEGYNLVLSALDHQQAGEIKTYIRNELITYLQTKGYQYQADPTRADVVIGFLFALEDNLADQSLQQKFGLPPGINQRGYAKGTLLLSVLDKQLKKVYWRSALQGFVDLERGKNDPERDRMQKILPFMMGDFPQAGR